MERYLLSYEMENTAHRRRLQVGGGVEYDSGGSSEQDRFRFRESWEASSSLDSESTEFVREGVADGLREGGNGCGVISWVTELAGE